MCTVNHCTTICIGYYDPAVKKHDHKAAQIDMIDRAINWAYGDDLKTADPKSTVDVGCGVGGSSRHILKRYVYIYHMK